MTPEIKKKCTDPYTRLKKVITLDKRETGINAYHKPRCSKAKRNGKPLHTIYAHIGKNAKENQEAQTPNGDDLLSEATGNISPCHPLATNRPLPCGELCGGLCREYTDRKSQGKAGKQKYRE